MLKRLMLFVCIGVMGIGIVFASGCSRTQIAYNHFDWFLLKRIDHYFTLTSSQETYLEQKITVLHTWHRQRELPILVDALRELQTRFQGPALVAVLCIEALRAVRRNAETEEPPGIARRPGGPWISSNMKGRKLISTHSMTAHCYGRWGKRA